MDANGKKISERVIGCAFAVSKELGAGFLEAVYTNALAVALKEEGVAYEREKALSVSFRGQVVGNYFADFVVEGRLVLELKALSALTNEHEAQVMNYLRASNLKAGLLLNFGRPRLDVRRLVLGHDDAEPI